MPKRTIEIQQLAPLGSSMSLRVGAAYAGGGGRSMKTATLQGHTSHGIQSPGSTGADPAAALVGSCRSLISETVAPWGAFENAVHSAHCTELLG